MRVCALSVKYNIMREMVNKVTFLTNVGFMVLNNATFLVQWMILLRMRGDVGGYTMREIMLLWGFMAASFGLSHILFARACSLSDLIIKGKLDSFLVQPKNVLVSVLTSATDSSAIGDFLYGTALVCACKPGVGGFFLFLLLVVTGTVIFTAFAVLLGSLSFWFVRMDMVQDQMVMNIISFATYPDGIFNGVTRFLLYFVIPAGMTVWHPVHMLVSFEAGMLFTVLGYAAGLTALAVAVFYRGLRRYASGNLMEARL